MIILYHWDCAGSVQGSRLFWLTALAAATVSMWILAKTLIKIYSVRTVEDESLRMYARYMSSLPTGLLKERIAEYRYPWQIN